MLNPNPDMIHIVGVPVRGVVDDDEGGVLRVVVAVERNPDNKIYIILCPIVILLSLVSMKV